MSDIEFNKRMNIFCSAIPFVKDSLERRRIYYVLRDYSNKNNPKFDGVKLAYITILSLESILKAVAILEFPEEVEEKWILKYLKAMSHDLIKCYRKIESGLMEEWFDIGKVFSDEETSLIEKRSSYAKDIKYKIDASIKHWLYTKWLVAWDGREMENINIEVYEHIQWKLILIWQRIVKYKYWGNLELGYIKSLDEESTLKIPEKLREEIENMYFKKS